MSYNVESVSTKQVKTKFGMKPTFSLKCDGEWYSCGFKKPPCKEGDVVEFTFSEDSYGKKVDDGSMRVVSSSGPRVATPTPTAAPAGGGKPYGPPAKPFPIPPLHGDRAIVRQNALTNAREVMVAAMNTGKGFTVDIDVFAELTIKLARKFEAYSCGDLDMEAAMKDTEE